MTSKERTFLLEWCNWHLSSIDMKINDIYDIVKDKNLSRLLSILVKDDQDGDVFSVKKYLETKDVGVNSISDEDIKNKQKVAQLVWAVSDYYVQCIKFEDLTGNDALLRWCQKKKNEIAEIWKSHLPVGGGHDTKKKKNKKKKDDEMDDEFIDSIIEMQVENYGSFKDGWILYSLVKSLIPDQKLNMKKKAKAGDLVKESFLDASTHLNVQVMLEDKDVINSNEKLLKAYVASLYFVESKKVESQRLFEELKPEMKYAEERVFEAFKDLNIGTLDQINEYFRSLRPGLNRKLEILKHKAESIAFKSMQVAWEEGIISKCEEFEAEQNAPKLLSDFKQFCARIKYPEHFSLEQLENADEKDEFIILQDEYDWHAMLVSEAKMGTLKMELDNLIEKTDVLMKSFKDNGKPNIDKGYSRGAQGTLVMMEYTEKEILRFRIVYRANLEGSLEKLTDCWNLTNKNCLENISQLSPSNNQSLYTRITIKSLEDRLCNLEECYKEQVKIFQDLIASTPPDAAFIIVPSFTKK